MIDGETTSGAIAFSNYTQKSILISNGTTWYSGVMS